jgi:hypothetical protein
VKKQCLKHNILHRRWSPKSPYLKMPFSLCLSLGIISLDIREIKNYSIYLMDKEIRTYKEKYVFKVR